MENKKTSTFSNGLIWFGAGVSLAEIVTGTFVAPLGMKNGLISIVFGHVIGCILLFLAGLIGGREKKSSMESAGIAFGNKGNILFALLNVLQLVGWTGIMIYDGAVSAKGILDLPIFIWAIIIGGLIVIWIIAGLKDLGKISVIVMAALFILTIVLSVVIFRNPDGAHSISDKITFGAAVELSVAMPLSWFPVISDYTTITLNQVKPIVKEYYQMLIPSNTSAKKAMSLIIVYIMISSEVAFVTQWELAEKEIAKVIQIEDRLLLSILKQVFEQLHSGCFWEITPDFIITLGETYLCLVSDRFLRNTLKTWNVK